MNKKCVLVKDTKCTAAIRIIIGYFRLKPNKPDCNRINIRLLVT